MAFLIGGANSAAADTGYDIDNSLRFNDDDSPELNMQLDTPTSDKIYTFSLWAKRGNLGLNSTLIGHYSGSGDSLLGVIQFTSAGKLRVSAYDDEYDASPTNFLTTRVFRDPSAWYHIVIAVDTTDGTEANRFKIYVNGVQESVFDTEAYPTLNKVMVWNKDDMYAYYGIYKYAGGVEHDGYISELHFIDGTQLAASAFGEFDEDSGIWKPKDAKDDLTYGNNGHYLEFKETGTNQDSSGIGADTSGNDNHFAVTNLVAGDVGTDSPTNNFATWSSIAKNPDLIFSDGSLRANNTGTDSFRSALGTIGVSSGKWYWEFRGGATGDSQTFIVGWTKADVDYSARIFADSNPTVASDGYGYRSDGNKVNNDSASAYGSSWSSGTVVGIRLDLDSGTIGFIHSSDQGDAYTGLTTGIFYLPFCAVAQASNGEDAFSYTNFGGHQITANYGDFGTNTDANGYGGFTYSVPSGYYSLCTKNLAEFG